MRIIKISDNLYRINGKDVWIKNGEIEAPRTPHDTLTETEKQAIEMKIF